MLKGKEELHMSHTLTWRDQAAWSEAACTNAFSHKRTLLLCLKCSDNSGCALAAHMTEIECEISPQTFMSADLHYITPLAHRRRRELEQGRKQRKCEARLNGGEGITLEEVKEKKEWGRTRDGGMEKMGSGGSGGTRRPHVCFSQTAVSSSYPDMTSPPRRPGLHIWPHSCRWSLRSHSGVSSVQPEHSLASAGTCSSRTSCLEPLINHAVFTTTRGTE